MYIFDEAACNIDVESEERIMEVIHELARTKDRASDLPSDWQMWCSQTSIYFLKDGEIQEKWHPSGTDERKRFLQDNCMKARWHWKIMEGGTWRTSHTNKRSTQKSTVQKKTATESIASYGARLHRKSAEVLNSFDGQSDRSGETIASYHAGNDHPGNSRISVCDFSDHPRSSDSGKCPAFWHVAYGRL